MLQEVENRLQDLYGQLADLIPQALAEDFIGAGYAKGKDYHTAEKRILVVEKVPRPQQPQQPQPPQPPQHAADCGDATHSHGGAPHEAHQGLHQGPEEDERDFTGVIGVVARKLLGAEGSAWQDSIAWSYLYKLAPRIGKPDANLYAKQKALCEEIIKTEIRLLEPTHVLFLTGWGGIWDFDLPLSSMLKGEAVEGWGRTEEGTKLIVTRYAVGKPEREFAMDILRKIELLEEADS